MHPPPIGMFDQLGAHLRQFRLADGAALNDAMFEHGREDAPGRPGSAVLNGTVLAASKPPEEPEKLVLQQTQHATSLPKRNNDLNGC